VEGTTIQKHYSQGSEIVQTPLVVLVNGYTASAAEILASALRTYANAVIIGSQTYGK
jgi:carboxyl-terminal processing protease